MLTNLKTVLTAALITTMFFSHAQSVKKISSFDNVFNVQIPIDYKSFIFFSAFDKSDTSMQLFKLNENSGTAKRITDFKKGRIIGNAEVFNDKLYFLIEKENKLPGEIFPAELFVSDGTNSGTYKFDGFPVDMQTFDPGMHTIYKNRLYYFYHSQGPNPELWCTDGTSGGAKKIRQFARSNTANRFYECMDKLFIIADDDIHGIEIWILGQDNNVQLLKDINQGKDESTPGNFIEFHNKIFFQAVDNTKKNQLWVTDGTATGTHKITNTIDENYSMLSNLCKYKDKLYLSAYWGGQEHFCNFDGATVKEIKTLNEKTGTISGSLIPFDEGICFGFYDRKLGRELGWSDGTAQNTGLLKDIYNGSPSSNLYALISLEHSVLFVASSAPNESIWITKGTKLPSQKIYPKAEIGFEIPINIPVRQWSSTSKRILFIGNENNMGKQIYEVLRN